jgi:hypothetical protein
MMEKFIMEFLICALGGVACFGLFYKCVGWFDKI